MLMWRYKGPTAEGVTYTHGASSKYSPFKRSDMTWLRGIYMKLCVHMHAMRREAV